MAKRRAKSKLKASTRSLMAGLKVHKQFNQPLGLYGSAGNKRHSEYRKGMARKIREVRSTLGDNRRTNYNRYKLHTGIGLTWRG